jgi:hypothetical protein
VLGRLSALASHPVPARLSPNSIFRVGRRRPRAVWALLTHLFGTSMSGDCRSPVQAPPWRRSGLPDSFLGAEEIHPPSLSASLSLSLRLLRDRGELCPRPRLQPAVRRLPAEAQAMLILRRRLLCTFHC